MIHDILISTTFLVSEIVIGIGWFIKSCPKNLVKRFVPEKYICVQENVGPKYLGSKNRGHILAGQMPLGQLLPELPKIFGEILNIYE